MKEILVASGKGGVGKTTVAASLAVFLSERGFKLVTVDADVDAPNLSITLGGGKTKALHEITISHKAVINPEKCSNCGKCVETCQFGAVARLEKSEPPVIAEILCEGCGACVVACPEKAIRLEERRTGELRVEETKYGFPLVTGKLVLGEHNSGHLVTSAKKFGRLEAEKSGASLLVVDGAPGIGCPVIASVAGADYVLAVTEPTPAAKRDLERLIHVVKHFGVPCGMVINRADLSPRYRKEIREKISRKLAIPVLGEIPIDYEVLKALNSMTPIIRFNPEAKASKALKTIFKEVAETVLEGKAHA
ncbi:hypothetical protein DRO50_01530 [Candidatus Bathyarchaeota archaeon]|nr:MAG: hypothetical protein DRO50_01530 [Candidatus Bathyarchaeota archaeon]